MTRTIPSSPAAAASFAAAYAALHASHEVADHWLQTGHQAAAKDLPGWPGRRACAAHVATYTAAQALTLAVTARVTGARLAPARAAAALAVSAVRPLRRRPAGPAEGARRAA